MFQGAPPAAHISIHMWSLGGPKPRGQGELPPPWPSAHTTQLPGVRQMELQNCGVIQWVGSIEESRNLILFKDLKSRSTPSP